MEAPTGFGRRVRAGLFEVDLGSGEVHKSGRKVPLQEQPFRVLAMLLERPGEIVTREELQARLWPADTFVGFDEGINTAIRKLRIVFGDSADNPRFIETIPRRGYRFIAPAVPSASRETEHPTTAPSMSGASGTAELPIVQTQPTRRFGGSVLEGVKQHKLGLTAGLVVGLVLLTAAGYGVYAVFTRGRAAVPFQNYTISQITDNAKTQAAIISPDGKYILSEIVDAGMSSLWLHHIPTNSDTQVVAPSEVFYTNFDFSPDGNYFYFRKARNSTLDEFDLYRAPVLGGNPRVVVRDTDSDTGFSPDGKHIAYERGNDPDVGKFQLLIANADGTNEKVVAGGPIGSLHRYVALSPDGERFALTDVVGDAPAPIQLMEVASRKTRDLAAINGFVFLKSIWLPDGHGLLVQYQDVSAGMNHNQIGFISYPNGQFHTITKDTNSYESLSLSADAKTLATVQLKRLFTLYVIPAAGTGANSPTPAMPQQQKGSLTFNWAGNDNFYMAEDRQLVRVSSDGSNKTTLLNNTSITSLSVCPDGRTLLLSLIGQGGGTGTNIWRVSADGANLKQLSHGQRDRSPECSKDSKWAYYVNANASRVERVPVDGGTPEALAGTPIPHALILDRYFDLSPDGRTAAFLISLGGASPVHKIALVPLEAGNQPPVRWLDPHPAIWYPLRFTPDGKALVYPITQNRIENLWLQPLDGSPGRQITNNFTSDLILGLQWSPDAKNIGLLSRRIDADVVLLRQSNTTQ
ncbi:MAG: winged helix-turn-helix domain-containing protein [Candidatus Sulfotelmatobacter sp.]